MISATILVPFKYPTNTSAYTVKPEYRHTKTVSCVSQKPIFSKILVLDSKRLRNRAKIKNTKDKTIKKSKKTKKKDKKKRLKKKKQ